MNRSRQKWSVNLRASESSEPNPARRATHGEVLSATYKEPAPRRETWSLQESHEERVLRMTAVSAVKFLTSPMRLARGHPSGVIEGVFRAVNFCPSSLNSLVCAFSNSSCFGNCVLQRVTKSPGERAKVAYRAKSNADSIFACAMSTQLDA
jgi:hypothetical protein